MGYKWTSDHKWKLSKWPQSGMQETNTNALCVNSWGAKPHSKKCLQSFNVDSSSVLMSVGLMRLSTMTLINCWCPCVAWSPSDAGISMKRHGRLSVSLCRQSQYEPYYQLQGGKCQKCQNYTSHPHQIHEYPLKTKTICRVLAWLRYEANYSSWFPHWQINQVWLCVYSCQHGLQFRHSRLKKCTQERL